MKKLTMHCFHMLMLVLLLASYSCKRDTPNTGGGTTDKIPGNVRLVDYTASSIALAWDRVEGATSYTVELLESKDAKKPSSSWVVVAEDYYQFGGLKEIVGYYVRVRANVDYATGEWIYIMNGQQPGRIMPKYGFVAEDFEEPKELPGMYPNFPEGWEVHTATGGRKNAFTSVGPATGEHSDIFPSGEWLMRDIYTQSVASMEKNRIGDWATIFRGGGTYTPSLAMNFDLPKGASKLSFYYATATQNATDAGGVPLYVKVEYSKDAGVTWTQLGEELEISSAEDQYFKEYELDIKGPVRFRIGKNNASAARMMVDEISVYTNPD
ncbi:MAG TPA: fibronectin type III domain-containing protein [Niabella sp.]|nr:fibronectin type III domain-containing protein [Niabella sp.]